MKTRSSILSWEQQTDMQLNSSTEARAKSLELRNMVNQLINTSCKEAMSAWNQTNKYKTTTIFNNISKCFFRAFEERILETELAKKEAEENVEKSNTEIDSLDHNIKLIKLAIREKSNPLKVG